MQQFGRGGRRGKGEAPRGGEGGEVVERGVEVVAGVEGREVRGREVFGGGATRGPSVRFGQGRCGRGG